MRLWTGKVETEDPVEFPHLGRRSWRWVIELAFGGIWLTHEVRFGDDGEWRGGNGYYGVYVSGRFAFGADHVYYDGPHCGVSLGFLHINWQRDWCTKCMPEAGHT